MTPQEQGVFEVTNPTSLNARQIAVIKQHLALVLKHETKVPGMLSMADLIKQQFGERQPVQANPYTRLVC